MTSLFFNPYFGYLDASVPIQIDFFNLVMSNEIAHHSDHSLPEQKRSEVLSMMPFWLLAAVDHRMFCHIEFRMRQKNCQLGFRRANMRLAHVLQSPSHTRHPESSSWRPRPFMWLVTMAKRLMNDSGNKATHASGLQFAIPPSRILAREYDPSTIPAPQRVDTYPLEKFSLHAII